MKIVSYKVAKALKEAGFDDICEYAYVKNTEEEPKLLPMESDWARMRMCNTALEQYLKDICEEGDDVTAPTYVEAWLWLWKNKIIELSFDYGARMNDVEETLWCIPLYYHALSHPSMKYIAREISSSCDCCTHAYNHEHADPEEAIINTINFLTENNLIREPMKYEDTNTYNKLEEVSF